MSSNKNNRDRDLTPSRPPRVFSNPTAIPENMSTTPDSSPPDHLAGQRAINPQTWPRGAKVEGTASATGPYSIGIPNRLASHTYDRTRSILDLRSTVSGSLEPYNRSHAKLVNDLNRCLADLDIRLGLRTVPIAQACVRLEKLRSDMAEGKFDSEAALAATLLGEFHNVLNRLESICRALKQCDANAPCCGCQFVSPEHAGPEFNVEHHISGRTIQSFVDEHAKNHKTESGTLRAVYAGLSEFFQDILGRFDASKERCQTRDGFMTAWRMMTQQPAYLDQLDAEIGALQAQASVKRDKGEHVKKKNFARFSGLFSGGGKKGGPGGSQSVERPVTRG